MKYNFKQADFYKIGKYAFFVSFVIGVIRLIDTWKETLAYELVGMIASTVFAFALFQLFAFMQKKELVTELSDGDVSQMNKALDELNLAKKEQNGKERSK